MYDQRTLINIQAMGLDFVLDNNYFPGADEFYLSAEYSMLSFFDNQTMTLVLLKTVMYPANMNRHDDTWCVKEAGRIAREKGVVFENCVLLFMGVGLIQKGAPEAEKGLFQLGKTYSVALGDVFTIRKREEAKTQGPLNVNATNEKGATVLNYHRYQELQQIMQENGVLLDDSDIALYADLFEIIGVFIQNKLTTQELFEAYDFLSDLIQGNLPQHAAFVSKEDRVRIQLRYMEVLPQTSGRLTEAEKELFAFCVYYSTCVQVFDEESNMIKSALIEFTSVEKARELYEAEKKSRPSFFDLVNEPDYSNSEKYGLDPDYPIMLTSVSMSAEYMNALRFGDQKIEFERNGSMTNSRNEIIDAYSVKATEKGFLKKRSREWIIYINPYASKPAVKPPKGFNLWGNHS